MVTTRYKKNKNVTISTTSSNNHNNNNHNNNEIKNSTRNNYARLRISLSVIAITVIFSLYNSVTNVRDIFDAYNNKNDDEMIIYRDKNHNHNNNDDDDDESISISSSTTTTTTTTTTTSNRYLDRNKGNDQQTSSLSTDDVTIVSNANNDVTNTNSNINNINNNNNNTNNSPKNLHLIFIGDSVTRYQYLGLIYYLHTGRWVENQEQPNILRELDFNNWTLFYEYSNKVFDGKEKCDCYRNTTPDSVFEHRYYSDPSRNNFITYLRKPGSVLGQGHMLPHEAYQNIESIRCNYNYDNKRSLDGCESSFLWHRYYDYIDLIEPVWKYDWIDLIQNYAALLQPRPQYLIMNAGLWPHDLHNQTYLEKIQQVCQLHNITTIYKTTTSVRMDRNYTNYFVNNTYEINACRIMDICSNMSWTQNVPRSNDYFWDPLHYSPLMNRYFNEQLLHLLHRNDDRIDTNKEWLGYVV